MNLDIMQYVTEHAYVLIPALYILGMFIKGTPKIPDWTIPWILLILGIIGGVAIIGLNPDGVIQGILVAGATVMANQLIKQTERKD